MTERHQRSPRLLIAALLAAALLAPLYPAHATDTSAAATAPVAALHGALESAMREGSHLGCKGRSKLLRPVIVEAFDLPFLARQVVRRSWDDFDASQRMAFERALADFTVASYAANFSASRGEQFRTLESLPLPRNQMKLRTELRRPGQDSISFDYLLHLSGTQWRIINVVAAGVSDLAIRSAQYQSVLQARGTDGLIAWVEQQTRALLTDCGAR